MEDRRRRKQKINGVYEKDETISDSIWGTGGNGAGRVQQGAC